MGRANSEWLLTTVSAVRDLMIRRLEDPALDAAAHREVEMALEEIDVMWEELEAQATLLERENARYAEFFEFAPDAYVITDAGGGIREANEAAGELLKIARADMVGRPLCDFIADEDRVGFLARSLGPMLGRSPGSLAWQSLLQPIAGGPLRCQFSVRPIPLKKSGVAGLCWLIRPA